MATITNLKLFVLDLYLKNVRVDRDTRSQQEIDIRYKFDLTLIITALRNRYRLLQPFLS